MDHPNVSMSSDEGTRTSKPASLALAQTNNETGEPSLMSPMSPSEALRTPSESRYMGRPASPESSTHLPPRIHSPASQIFERDVQEDIVSAQSSSSIPAHIRTDNYIPPVLEASSVAITDDHLDPDLVEIVTHSLHQPAGATSTEHSMSSSIDAHLLNQTDLDDLSSSYGAFDTTDVRRLSFISFADVVNAEHVETNEAHLGGMSRERLGDFNYPPSPLRSPTSSHALSTSPPTSIAASFSRAELSPGDPTASSAQSPLYTSFGGDINVETMRQALRKTGSGDLGSMSSQTVGSIGDLNV